MRTVLRLFGGVTVGVAIALTAAPAAIAQQQPQSLTLTPAAGPAGSTFTISWANIFGCDILSFTLASRPVGSGGSKQTGSLTATVPADLTPGTYQVVGNCSNVSSIRKPFTVTAIETTPPVTTTTPATIPPVTVPPVTNPPGSKPPVSKPPVTTTTPPTSTTDPPTSTVDTPTSSSTKSDGDLVLDHPVIQPGDPLSASGQGCTPGSPVTLTSGLDQVGTAVASPDGTFRAPVEFTRIEAGRHEVVASCGIVLTGAVEQVVTSSTGGHSSTMIVLVFFILAGIAVLRFN
jgi:hypothetical protein